MGSRVDVEAGRVHEVWMGGEGCEYVIGKKGGKGGGGKGRGGEGRKEKERYRAARVSTGMKCGMERVGFLGTIARNLEKMVLQDKFRSYLPQAMEQRMS